MFFAKNIFLNLDRATVFTSFSFKLFKSSQLLKPQLTNARLMSKMAKLNIPVKQLNIPMEGAGPSTSRNMEYLQAPESLLELFKTEVVPPLDQTKHKGSCGIVGIVGGSYEYTGAPYFAAMSALRAGCDLVYIFCVDDAGIAIKSYSPDLIVHPILDKNNLMDRILPILPRLDVLVVGPGLGRIPQIQRNTLALIEAWQKSNKPLIFDADGLQIVKEHMELVNRKANIILTPNNIEFARFFGDRQEDVMSRLGLGVVVLEKSAIDRVHIPNFSEVYSLREGGSSRRCGGQGDLLAGALATFYLWSVKSHQNKPALVASYAASYLIRLCNEAAFKKYGRSMVASDMLHEIGPIFRDIFEHTT